MTLLKRMLVVGASIGWIVPLCAAFASMYDFTRIVWLRANFGTAYNYPWHPFDLADKLFYLSMVWLAIVVISWVLRATGKRP